MKKPDLNRLKKPRRPENWRAYGVAYYPTGQAVMIWHFRHEVVRVGISLDLLNPLNPFDETAEQEHHVLSLLTPPGIPLSSERVRFFLAEWGMEGAEEIKTPEPEARYFALPVAAH